MGTSWFTTVKKVFRSPSKTSPKEYCKRRDESRREDDEEEKKTEKRRWIFRKTTSNNQHQYETDMSSNNEKQIDSTSIHQRRCVAVRVKEMVPAYLAREYYAALIIQTAFRGYLARRALNALKGIVKLQALVRGHNIRKQAKTTLKCMQTLIRVQAKLRDQSLPRPSNGQTRKSMYAECNNLWDKYKDIHHRKPMFEDENIVEDQGKSYPYTLEDIEAIFQSKKETSLYREQALAYALSQQIRRFDRKVCPKEENKDDCEWLGQQLESKEYSKIDNRGTTNRIEAIKDVDIESLKSHLRTPSNLRQSHQHQDAPSRRHSLHAQPMTPTLHYARPMQAQSASPRCSKGYRSHSAATTPSLRHRPTGSIATTPNYMAATESAKAKARTQSTPRQRHSTSSDRSKRSTSVKKRLSFPVPNEVHYYHGSMYNDYSCYSHNLRSPSFRSVQEGLYSAERGTTCSYTDITGGEISPASTSHLRRWLS